MADYKWYTREDKTKLNYSKPIAVERIDENVVSYEILLPVRNHRSYDVVGYDWFNITTGCWTSCKQWAKPEEAVHSRKEANYKVVNTGVHVSLQLV